MVLTLVPDELTRSILTDWLTIVDVTHLDSAYCSHEQRPCFMSCAYTFPSMHHELQVEKSASFKGDIDFVIWAVERKVQLLSVTIPWELRSQDALAATLMFLFTCCTRATSVWCDLHDGHKKPHQKHSDLIQWIGQMCPLLAELSVYGSVLTQGDAEKLFRGKMDLHTLKLQYCRLSARALLPVAKHCSNLTSLDLSSAYNVTSEGIAAIAQGCTGLKVQNLSPSRTLSASGLQAVGQYCKQLEVLDVSEALGLAAGVLAVVEGCPMLRRLSIADNDDATDAVLLALSSHSSQLEYLDVSWCRGVSDAGMTAVLRRCRLLRDLRLDGTDFTDITLRALASHCPGIATLHMCFCEGFTAEGMRQLARGCRQLGGVRLSLPLDMADPDLEGAAGKQAERQAVALIEEFPEDAVEHWDTELHNNA